MVSTVCVFVFETGALESIPNKITTMWSLIPYGIYIFVYLKTNKKAKIIYNISSITGVQYLSLIDHEMYHVAIPKHSLYQENLLFASK